MTADATRPQTTRAFAPASTGNVSVGFDALGLALAPEDGTLLGDVVTVRDTGAEAWSLDVTGPFASALPPDPEDNIVLASCRRFEAVAREMGKALRPLAVTLDKRLPVGSGLGSSASSIVATFVALNHHYGRPLGRRSVLALMAEMEAAISGGVHLDNIAPSLFGGLRLCPPGAERQFGLPWPASWRSVVAWPGTRVVTREARSVLPERIDRAVAVAHGAQFAQFVHALHTGDTAVAAESLYDLIAEPYRRALLPGLVEARLALQSLGALAVGISGSGPTLFAIVDDSQAAGRVADWLRGHWLQDPAGFVHVCRADLAGARLV